MLDFNLEYYRAFYYVSKLGNVTKAADAMFLSQPAISRAIQKLEDHLKIELFHRTAKGMVLTLEGQHLFEHVSAAFDCFVKGEQELQYHQQHKAGTIKIAATETPLYNFLLSKIESFKRLNPQAYIHVTGSSSSETISLLRAGLVDLSFAVSPIEAIDDLKIIEGESFQDIFVAGPSYANLRDRVLSTPDICGYPLITVERGTSARALIDLWFQEQGVFFEPTYSVRTSTTVLPFVERNLGIGIIPRFFAKGPIQENKIFEIKTEKPLYMRKMLIIHLEGSSLSSLCKQFLSHILSS